MDSKNNLIKTERMPGTWCPGCGIGILINSLSHIMSERGMNKNNTTMISGIGCSGRVSGYFNLDSVHTPHGRAIPVAEGIKLANPKLNVFVVSGDGDLLSIGLNHLEHAARRNIPLKVICLNNQVYGMTGGQASPTTEKGTKTLTTPEGSEIEPVNAHNVLSKNKKIFFGRATTANPVQMKEIIQKAISHSGFSFVEIITPCFTNLGSKNNYKGFAEMYSDLRKNYILAKNKKELQDSEIGYIEKD